MEEQVETALIYDSVLLLAKALHELYRSQMDRNIWQVRQLRGRRFLESWTEFSQLHEVGQWKPDDFLYFFLSLDGNVLTDPLLQIEIGRLTIERGVEVTIEGIQTVGTWNQTEEGANWPTHPHVAVAWFKNKDGDSSFNNNNNNKTLIVCSIFVSTFFLNINIQTSDSFIYGKQSNPDFIMKESNGSSFFFFRIITDEITKMRLGLHYKLKNQKKWSKILPTDPWTKRRASGTVRIHATAATHQQQQK